MARRCTLLLLRTAKRNHHSSIRFLLLTPCTDSLIHARIKVSHREYTNFTLAPWPLDIAHITDIRLRRSLSIRLLNSNYAV